MNIDSENANMHSHKEARWVGAKEGGIKRERERGWGKGGRESKRERGWGKKKGEGRGEKREEGEKRW